MRISRDTIVLMVITLLLVALTVLAAVQQAKDTQPPALASYSSAPNGALALKTWLEAIGYSTLDAQSGRFQPPEDADFAFILEPTFQFDASELSAIDRYVESGGILIAAGSGPVTWQLMNHFDFELMAQFAPKVQVQLQAPWRSPVYTGSDIDLHTTAYLIPQRSDFVTQLAVDEEPVVVSFHQGKGQVFLSASAHPFTNAGLKEAGMAQVVTNLVSFGGPKALGQIWFDEWHHGLRTGEYRRIVGPVQWLRRTPPGQALLFVGGLIFLALVLQGKRFGRPSRPPHEITRRRPLEHITALANLSRRAGHRSEILRQYHRRLKRDLGSRYRLDPTLPDAEWVAQLAAVRPDVDQENLLNLLNNLQRANVTEGEMVRLVKEASEWVGAGRRG